MTLSTSCRTYIATAVWYSISRQCLDWIRKIWKYMMAASRNFFPMLIVSWAASGAQMVVKAAKRCSNLKHCSRAPTRSWRPASWTSIKSTQMRRIKVWGYMTSRYPSLSMVLTKLMALQRILHQLISSMRTAYCQLICWNHRGMIIQGNRQCINHQLSYRQSRRVEQRDSKQGWPTSRGGRSKQPEKLSSCMKYNYQNQWMKTYSTRLRRISTSMCLCYTLNRLGKFSIECS